MTQLSIVLYVVFLANSITHSFFIYAATAPYCDGRQANFDKSVVMGTWYVVAMIPRHGMSELQYMPCYKMDLSEPDEAEMLWLVRRRIQNPTEEFISELTHRLIRQRFHSEKPFDIWSKGYYQVKGCFKQLFSLKTNNTNVADGTYYNNYMQLNIVNTDDSTGPYLAQILWNRLISVIIYRRTTGVTSEQLEPVYDLIRGFREERTARICDLPMKVT